VPAAIGVDLGGTKIAAGVVDEGGTILARRRIETIAADASAVLAGITKVVGELHAAAPAAVGVGVGAAGLVDSVRGVVLSAPNIALHDLHLGAMLTDRVGMPVLVDNDANVAALGEARFGAGKGVADQVMVTVGTGIGGGFVLDGRLYRGAHGFGAEVGHMVVDPNGATCACGNVGCWETVASGSALGRRAREAAGRPEARALVDVAGGDPGSITGETVGDAVLAGDPFARALVADAGRWLGLGLANLVNLLDPDLLVVGGGVAAGLGELLLEPARAAMGGYVIGPGRALPPVVQALLGNDAGLVGAATLALERAG
jgi:glucokinase